MDEDEYDDGTIDLYKQLDDLGSASVATQKAIEITTDFVLQRLSIQVVTKLVMISLVSEVIWRVKKTEFWCPKWMDEIEF